MGLVPSEPSELSDPSVLGQGTDWQHVMFQNVWLQKHTLSLNGGNDKTLFYLSADYLNQNGIAVGSAFKRGSVRLNLSNQANKWLKISTNISGYGDKENVNVFQGNLINLALGQNPTIPAKNPDGTFGGPDPAQVQYSNTNPLAVAELNNNYNTNYGVIGGLSLDITPIRGWSGIRKPTVRTISAIHISSSLRIQIGAYVNPNATIGQGAGA